MRDCYGSYEPVRSFPQPYEDLVSYCEERSLVERTRIAKELLNCLGTVELKVNAPKRGRVAELHEATTKGGYISAKLLASVWLVAYELGAKVEELAL